jgi:aspartyl-tRNA(Asn)/glutamyl-tRNA(Gln) amidotransferase subunit A
VLEPVDIPSLGEAGRVNRILVATEAFAIHQSRLKALETEGDPQVYRRIISGGTFSQQERDEALVLRREACLDFNDMARAFDVLISPTAAITAPLIAEVESDFDRLNALILRNPSAVNVLDGCAATIPMDAPDELGAGLMVIGANGSDWKVLAGAEALERIVARR